METNFPVLISSSGVWGAMRITRPSVIDPEMMCPRIFFILLHIVFLDTRRLKNLKSVRPECFMERRGIKCIEGYNFSGINFPTLSFDTFLQGKNTQGEREKEKIYKIVFERSLFFNQI